MPKVPLTATRDFTYMTRRLTAGDPFEARNPLEAKILTRVRKVAEVPAPKVARKAPEPPVEAEEATLAPVEAKPAKPKAGTKARAKKAAKKA